MKTLSELYELTLKEFENPKCIYEGICEVIAILHLIHPNLICKNDVIRLHIHFMKQHNPKIHFMKSAYWFDENDRKSRIELLKSLIKKTNRK